MTETKERQRRQAYFVETERLSHTGSFGWNVSTDQHFWSDETFRIFEFDPTAPVSLPTILERIHPDDMPAVERTIAAANRAEGIDLEFRLLMPDARIKHLHVVGKAERDETGAIEIIGALMDITARKRTEIELRRSKAHLADAQRLSRTGSVGIEVSTKRLFWSDEAARIYGYVPGTEPTPDLILQRSHPDDVGRLADVLGRAAQGGGEFDWEHRLLMPDGSIKHLHDLAHSVTDEAGNKEIVGAIMDVTERKMWEHKIREQEIELRQILDLTPQLIAVFGPRRERLFTNRMALDYFGLTLDEWRKTCHGAFGHPDDTKHVVAEWDRAMSSGSAFELEVRMRKSDGTFHWFLNRFNPLCDHEGQVLRWYVAYTDIENRKLAEERLQQENVALREEIDKASMFEEIVGGSPALEAVLSRMSKVADTDSTVLISGESGTGKELVARAIHRRSKRASGAFVGVNCGAIPRDLIASELFGHEKGAFTGALARRLGRFELAQGGTIFLDEVGELSFDAQVSLLRVLQEREFERVGGRERIRVDVRVIAASNRDLAAAVEDGTFRQDLYYRLNVFPLEMPPLRERQEDIPVLVEYFVARYGRKAGKAFKRVSKQTLEHLQSYRWPGNVRELQNVIERSVIVSETDEFRVDESWLLDKPSVQSRLGLPGTMAAHEKTIIEDALRASGGRVFGPSGAAARLGIPRSTLEWKIRALKISKNRFKAATPKRS